MKVSVIIPNYNHEVFLQKRIDSVLNQTYHDFELIILDDCSTDNSRQLLESYKGHPKLSHLVFNKRNTGNTFTQWEKGIELAKGELIWIAESDDWCEKTFLEELVLPMQENSSIVLSYCQCITVNVEQQILAVGSNPKMAETIDGKKYVLRYMLGSNSIYNASMAVFRKDAAEKISPDYSKLFYCGDWLFWTELALTGSVFMNGKCLNYFRKHANDVSSKAIGKGLLFTEGKVVFDYICTVMKPDIKNIKNLFEFRISQYAKNRNNFNDALIGEKAIKAMKAMDTKFHRHLLNYRIRNKLINLINKYFK